jgi:hypothetical protein
MYNHKLSLLVLLMVISGFCLAQKSSSKTFTVIYTIDPIVPIPEKSILYSSLIKTPLDPLTPDETPDGKTKEEREQNIKEAQQKKLVDVAKKVLVIPGNKYKASDINAEESNSKRRI